MSSPLPAEPLLPRSGSVQPRFRESLNIPYVIANFEAINCYIYKNRAKNAEPHDLFAVAQ
jgi:hypothetical protein